MLEISAIILFALAGLIPPLRSGWYFLHMAIVIGAVYYAQNNAQIIEYLQVDLTLHNQEILKYFIALHLVSINIIIFLAYGYDKAAAMENKWRISENLLHALALVGGTPMAFVARKFFRHKTKKESFIKDFQIIIIMQIAIIAMITYAPVFFPELSLENLLNQIK